MPLWHGKDPPRGGFSPLLDGRDPPRGGFLPLLDGRDPPRGWVLAVVRWPRPTSGKVLAVLGWPRPTQRPAPEPSVAAPAPKPQSDSRSTGDSSIRAASRTDPVQRPAHAMRSRPTFFLGSRLRRGASGAHRCAVRSGARLGRVGLCATITGRGWWPSPWKSEFLLLAVDR